MRCHELRQFGLANLVQTERPDPAPGPGEVLVRVRAASLNYRDLLMVEGKYNPKQPLPLVPLSDGAGEIVHVGGGVTQWRTGDRVAAIFSQRWLAGPPTKEKLSAAMGGPLDGMLTEYRVLPAEGLVRVPDHLSFEEAATLPCAAVTAWSAVIEQGAIKPGDVVLVLGTGGVSIFALQFAKLAGARVIVTSSSDAKLERARSLGAGDCINYRTTPDWAKRAKELTGGVGVDHIVEVGGGHTFAQSLRAVRVAGTVSVIGVLGGSTTDTTLIPILMQNLKLQGVVVGSRETFIAMNRAIDQNKLRPVIDKVFDAANVNEAFAHLRAGKHFGKIVVTL